MEERVKKTNIFGGAKEEKSVRTLSPEILKKVNEIISNNQEENSTSDNWITPEMISEVQEQLSGLEVTITLKPEWITEQLIKDIDLHLQTCGGRSSGNFDKYWVKSVNNVLGRAAFESEFLDSYTHTDGGRTPDVIIGTSSFKTRDAEPSKDGVYVKQLANKTILKK